MTDTEWESAITDEPAELTPFFSSAKEFFTQQLAPMYCRAIDGHTRTWCPQWWLHPEALARIDALWRAWENLRLDGAFGMTTFFRDHADHHLAILLDPEGPFKRCSIEAGHAVERALPELPTGP